MPGPGGIVPGIPGTPIGRGMPGCAPIGGIGAPTGRGGMPGWPIGGRMPGCVPIGCVPIGTPPCIGGRAGGMPG